MDRNLALEAVRVTEAAALAAARLMGRGDEKAADQAAVDAMRSALNSLNNRSVLPRSVPALSSFAWTSSFATRMARSFP